MKRQRGRNRNKAGGANANNANPNRSWDSQGPENIKVRGNAQTVYERYLQLGRDATASGDRVLAENYLQHAEHYFRVLRALQPARPVSEIAARELSNQGFDIDFEDESGAQAAAFLAAQQAAERAQNGGGQTGEPREARDGDSRDGNRNEGGQREWRDREQHRDNSNREDREARAEGEEGQGGRRETRRERWERRREERNRRFEAEGGTGDTPEIAGQADEETSPAAGPPEDVAPARAERPRRSRMPQDGDDESAPAALPGFLTRTPVSAASGAEDAPAGEDETPAPKRRASRRKPEAASSED